MSNVRMPYTKYDDGADGKAIASFKVKKLLCDASQYVVPMYQRNYAWGEGEINQLIQDVLDYQHSKPDQNLTTLARWSCLSVTMAALK